MRPHGSRSLNSMRHLDHVRRFTSSHESIAGYDREMFECRSCILRCIRAIAPEITNSQYSLRNPLTLTPRLNRHSRRRYASAAIATHIQDDLDKAPAWAEQPMALGRPLKERTGELSISDRRALQREMRYLKDPVKFAEHVHYTLRCDKPDKALELCRLASKSMNCVVGWNHAINWLMRKERTNEAIKVYNEMKKRAQFPDSYTYLLLLRGFPQHRTHHGPEVKKELVAKAVSIYNSMSSPTSKVKPGIIHTNAALRVCSLGRDMDALWGIVSQLPETGPGSADCITYTILLSAIRYTANSDQPDLSSRRIAQTQQRAVDEGRRIWQDIIVRWRGGEVLIDEQLVCEMGNLLLVSKRIEDWDDVLNLIQQTTSVGRLLPTLGSPERHVEHVPISRASDEEDSADISGELDGWTPTPANHAFKPMENHRRTAEKSQRSNSPAWVQPSNAMLSVIMDACTKMRSAKALIQYWDLLVRDHGLTPDRANYQVLLRFLRINRNSARAATVVQEMSDKGIELRNQTFRIALSVCARNPKNPNVLSHAHSIVQRMFQSQNDPDIPTLESYLDLARALKDGRQIASVLDQLEATMDNLGSQVQSGVRTYLSDNNTAASFFRVVIGAINALCRDESATESDVGRWKAKRVELDKLIVQATNNVELRKQHKSQREGSMRQHVDIRRSPQRHPKRWPRIDKD